MKVSYSWLQEYVDAPLPPVEEVAAALTMHSFEVEGVEHVEGDAILDAKILPNRSHDLLSHYGIASEICSVMGLPRKPLSDSVSMPEMKGFDVKIEEKDLCRRMYAVLVDGVQVADSPEWLKRRLQAMGQRPINNIVDITNYISFALGQPMHAFDADTIVGKGIRVRKAKEGEKITLLDGKEHALSADMLVIADKEKALDVAGIMGGKDTATYAHTKQILLVVDNFDPVSIRKTAKKLGIRTDASVRFENDMSCALVDRAMSLTLKLISELAGGTVACGTDVYPNPQKQTIISVTVEKVSNILGVTLDAQTIISLLARQSIVGKVRPSQTGEVASQEEIVVEVPLERLDLNLPEDIAEEVGRLYGYENIAPVHLEAGQAPETNKVSYVSAAIRNALVAEGFSEIYTYAFTNHGEVEVANPIASDKAFLRRDLATAMSASLDHNSKFLDLLGLSEVKLFEIGKVFTTDKESLHLSIGVKYPPRRSKSSAGQASREDEEIARAITVLEKALGISAGNVSIVGGQAELDLDVIVQALPAPSEYPAGLWQMGMRTVAYKPISPYPFAVRDVAVFVPSALSADDVRKLIETHLSPIVVRFSLFDTFAKANKTSYAFRLVFQSSEKTLTDEEINAVMNPIYETLKSQEGFEIR
jgi:phenylalanyl-tRNA synthetase beta chain